MGEIGSAVVDRLLPFEVEVTRVASRARTDERGPVHGIDELPALLPDADVLVVALPASPATDGLVGARVLSLLPDDALVVNVGRGRVVDTPALTEEVVSGRLRCALDVVEPEPFPGDHPLFRAPGAILTPHTGGSCTSCGPRVRRLLRTQLERIAAGERPLFLQQEGRLDVPAPGNRWTRTCRVSHRGTRRPEIDTPERAAEHGSMQLSHGVVQLTVRVLVGRGA